MGRWSWVDLRGKHNTQIRAISAYRVSQDSIKDAWELISCKQQVRSMMAKGIKNPNPKKAFLQNLTTFI